MNTNEAKDAACCGPDCCTPDVSTVTAEPVQLKAAIRERYAEVAEGTATCGSLCGCTENAEGLAIAFGYSAEELATLPEGANLGLSCGNPQAVAAMEPGETVLDLGSGAGFDCFLAARKVGPAGRVIGVDMTDAMLEKARANAEKAGLANVEFRKGEIEALPVEDDSVDVVISNCVLNLVPDKDRAFREIHRVLKPGGRLAVSDMAWEAEPAASVRKDLEALVGCIGGALVLDDYVSRLKRAGFARVEVEEHAEAARKMVEVSGTCRRPASSTAERQHHGHQVRSSPRMLSLLHHRGLCRWAAGPDDAGADVGPLVRALWLVQRYGTAEPSIPANDQRVKGGSVQGPRQGRRAHAFQNWRASWNPRRSRSSPAPTTARPGGDPPASCRSRRAGEPDAAAARRSGSMPICSRRRST